MTSSDTPGDDELYVVSETERSAALASLVGACSAGHVSLEELFRWTDEVLAARSRAELVAVTDKFEATPVPTGRVKRRWFVPFGNRIRRGRFVLPERTRAVVLAGEIHLDLRGATLVGPEPTIKLLVVIGTLRVLVPTGIHVEIDQSSMLGGRTITTFGPPPTPTKPVLRIRMVDMMGNVKVSDDPATWSPYIAPASGDAARVPTGAALSATATAPASAVVPPPGVLANPAGALPDPWAAAGLSARQPQPADLWATPAPPPLPPPTPSPPSPPPAPPAAREETPD